LRQLVTAHFTPQLNAPGVKEKCLGEMAEVFSGRIVWGEDLMEIPLVPDAVPQAGSEDQVHFPVDKRYGCILPTSQWPFLLSWSSSGFAFS